jgi:hypothetical protein
MAVRGRPNERFLVGARERNADPCNAPSAARPLADDTSSGHPGHRALTPASIVAQEGDRPTANLADRPRPEGRFAATFLSCVSDA